MLEKLLQFVLHQRLLIILAAMLLLGAGIIAWNHLPMDAFPDATNQQVMILTEAPGLTPTEVERLVTFPIEINMGGLPGVRQVRSLSKIGLSQVIIIFEDNIDTYFARQVVFERLAQAAEQLPEGIEPELGPISTGLGVCCVRPSKLIQVTPRSRPNWRACKRHLTPRHSPSSGTGIGPGSRPWLC